MKNTVELEEKYGSEYKRRTFAFIAKKIHVTPKSVLAWYTQGKMPRSIYIGMLADYFNVPRESIIESLKRCHDITNAGYKIPFGQIVSPNMLIESHARLLNGKDPFPEYTGNAWIHHMEYY